MKAEEEGGMASSSMSDNQKLCLNAEFNVVKYTFRVNCCQNQVNVASALNHINVSC